MRHRHAVPDGVQADDVAHHHRVIQTTRQSQGGRVGQRQAHQGFAHLVHRRTRVVDGHMQVLHQGVQRWRAIELEHQVLLRFGDFTHLAQRLAALGDTGEHLHLGRKGHAAQATGVHTMTAPRGGWCALATTCKLHRVQTAGWQAAKDKAALCAGGQVFNQFADFGGVGIGMNQSGLRHKTLCNGGAQGCGTTEHLELALGDVA